MAFVLTINAGSSSVKIAVFDGALKNLLELDRSLGENETHTDLLKSALDEIFQKVDGVTKPGDFKWICHRIVHGGEYTEPIEINSEVVKHLEELTTLAPLHNAPALELVKTCADMSTNIAVFDTTFHHSLPLAVRTYAIDQKVAQKKKLRKYGFHGISYANILRQTSNALGKKPEDTSLIVLHLGSGASACAIKHGQSIETSMGLTPLSGLMGSSRSGDVDPSLIFHFTDDASKLDTHLHISSAENILNKQSGWKAIAGTSNFGDISSSKDESARLAFDMFVDRILGFVGSYYVKLGGEVDALVFAGGVGEKSIELRAAITEKCHCLKFALEKHTNEVSNAPKEVTDISLRPTGPRVMICHTDEQFEMAKQGSDIMHDKRR